MHGRIREACGTLEEVGDRQPGVMRLDLAAFDPSADGHWYCLVAMVTIEVEKESKLLPIFPITKKDAINGLAAVKEALTLCNDRNLHQITGTRITTIQADGAREFRNQKLKGLCFDKNITLSSSPAHQPTSNGIAVRMVLMLKTTVRQLLKQAHLDRPWRSYASRFAGHMMA